MAAYRRDKNGGMGLLTSSDENTNTMNMQDRIASSKERAAGLALWSGPVEPVRLVGGITNVNFVVEAGQRYCLLFWKG